MLENQNFTFGIVVNINREEAIAAAASLVAWLQERGVKYLVEQSAAKLIGEKQRKHPNEFSRECDALISLGGDGTILRASHYAASKPLLGVNFGRLGFLAEFTMQEMYPAIERMLKGNYLIETRTQLEAKLKVGKQQKTFTSLNDVIVEKGAYPRVLTITIHIDGQFACDYRADGVIVATSTGSTAYSLSAGGPVIVPKSKVFVITPVCAHALTVRPIVVSDDKEIEITVETGHTHFILNCDGQLQLEVAPGERIRVRKARQVVNLVANEKRNYYDVLRTKLYWGQENGH